MANNTDNDPAMGDVADDAISLFRVNIFIIGVYISLIALLSNSDIEISQVLESWYTLLGLFFWLGTLSSCLIAYRSSRLKSISSGSNISPGEEQIVRNVAGSGLGTLLVVILLAFGLYEGAIGNNIPPQLVMWIVLVSIGAVGSVQVGVSILLKLFEVISRIGSKLFEYFWNISYIIKMREWFSSKFPEVLKDNQSVLSQWRDD